MLYPIKSREDLKILNELDALQNQVKTLGLEDKLGNKKLYEDMKKLFEPTTFAIKDASEIVTKTITENSKESNKRLAN